MQNPFSATAKPQISLAWIALLRIMLGLVFLTTWASNMGKGFYTPDGLIHFFSGVFPQAENPLGWYAAFIRDFILPQRYFFAPFQLISEFLIGLFLLVGLLTPWTSLLAGFFIINTFLATFGHDWPWSYAMILGMLFVIFINRAGRSLGLDAWLAGRKAKPPLPYLW
jgi:uncharacterized membrane protein YphA (DoxX/SURF4 family)